MNRRGFLAGILAAAAAPAIVRADSLMRIVPRESNILTPWDRYMGSEAGQAEASGVMRAFMTLTGGGRIEMSMDERGNFTHVFSDCGVIESAELIASGIVVPVNITGPRTLCTDDHFTIIKPRIEFAT